MRVPRKASSLLALLALAACSGKSKIVPDSGATYDAYGFPDLGDEDGGPPREVDGGVGPDAEIEDSGPSDALEPPDSGPRQPPTRSSTAATDANRFESPLAAALSPDGRTIYFSAYVKSAAGPNPRSGAPNAAIFQAVPGQAPVVIAQGPPLEMPVGLAVKEDGKSIYVADMASGAQGAILLVTIADGTVQTVAAGGQLLDPAGIVIDAARNQLVITGTAQMTGTGAIFLLPFTAMDPIELPTNGTLRDPSGVDITEGGIIYVLDAFGPDTRGVLRKIDQVMNRNDVVLNNLKVGYPAGLAVASDEGFALIATSTSANGGSSAIEVVRLPGRQRTRVNTGTTIIREARGIAKSADGTGFAVVDGSGGATGTGAVYELRTR